MKQSIAMISVVVACARCGRYETRVYARPDSEPFDLSDAIVLLARKADVSAPDVSLAYCDNCIPFAGTTPAPAHTLTLVK